MIIGQGMVPSLLGVAIGAVAAVALSRFLAELLYEVTPTDPLTYAGGGLLMTVVAFLACWVPARRAVDVSPMEALRRE